MPTRSPWVAAVLSLLLPGLGQLYNQERPKGVALLCMTAGITYGLVMSTLGPAAFRSLVTAVLLAVVIIGGIYGGVFTPTEASGVGFVCALVIVFAMRRMTWEKLKQATMESMHTTVTIFLIVAGAKVFSKAITLYRIPQDISALIAANIVNDLHALDIQALQYKLRNARINPYVRYTYVMDPEGVLLTDASKGDPLRGQKFSGLIGREMLQSDIWMSRLQDGVLEVAGPVTMADGSRIGYLHIGFSPDLAVGVFVGFDEPQTLGGRETGGSVAAPIFKDFMGEALADTLFLLLEGAYVARVTLGQGGPVASLSQAARTLISCHLDG